MASALKLQGIIVHAMALRDFTSRYAGSRFGVVMAIVDPIFMIATLFAFRYLIMGARVIHGVSLILFITTGYLTYHMFRLMVMDGLAATASRSPTLALPQVTELDSIVAALVSSWVTYMAVMIVCFAAAVAFFGAPIPSDLLFVVQAMLLVLWLGGATGIVLGVAARYAPVIRMFVGPVLRVLVIVSGALYLASELPQSLRIYAEWNPVFHVIEIMREGWFSAYASPVADLGFVLLCGIALTALALWLERLTRSAQF